MTHGNPSSENVASNAPTATTADQAPTDVWSSALVMILIWRNEKKAVTKNETARAIAFARMRLNGFEPGDHA